ncbi:N-6 DNA methylase, partial [Deinococcus sp. 12RED42]|uniref:Eco57I restriction-modification methylase domain-containing protein n=1 Tax=Deinococcus sp. 12RED42 TaxID=2745872 RepID=UPI001E50E35B|nr:N-6 DNA methylase [Deinococcus sp. 12RED42]
MSTDFLRAYLTDLAQIRSQGVAETSFYPPLDKLFNAVGQTLPTPVIHITHPKGKGAGLPDGGFFTPEQLKGDPNMQALSPSRGVCEVKGTGANLATLLKSAQVRKYLETYGQVLATNLYSFAVVELAQEGGKQVVRLIEQYDLADSEEAFWQQAANPQEIGDLQGERFIEFLRRGLMRRASLSRPVDLALFLASYAKEARLRLEVNGTTELSGLRNALEELLGVSFRTEQGEHFFRATLVQTLFYGLFSAWVIHHEAGNTAPFNWRGAAFDLHLRVLQRLFSEVAKPATMRSMNLVEVMDQAQEVLDRVNREAFFARFSGAHAVQYFYEPFLAAYDPELREQFGVWYTPDEVVTYMVEQVDRALRDELGLPLGLASEEVVILDPCTGTGTYILKVLERIHRTLQETGQADAFSGHDLKEIALKRVFGFELMPAPFVVAHMRLNMQLKQFGIELGEDERLGVYLTNALTGYEDKGSPDLATFGEFLSEWQESSQVKQNEPVLVVIGNPPYAGFKGVGMDEEKELSNAYRTSREVPAPVGDGLNKLYVRFFRIAERQLTTRLKRGIVSMITPTTWLDGWSFTGMREHYLEAFDEIRVDNLNGDRFRTGKVTPEGKPDPSIFSTPFNREGIQVGTAIALMVRKEDHKPAEAVQYRELWGTDKLKQLAQESLQGAQPKYIEVRPELKLGAPFRPTNFSSDYLTWPTLTDLFPVSFPGVKTSRDAALVSIDEAPLRARIAHYLDPQVKDSEVAAASPVLMASTARFPAASIRASL